MIMMDEVMMDEQNSPIKANHSQEWDPRQLLTKLNGGAPDVLLPFLLSQESRGASGGKVTDPHRFDSQNESGGEAGLPNRRIV